MNYSPWHKIIVSLCLLLFVSSCATTTGPQVNAVEIQQKTRALKEKAREFERLQQARVEALATHIISFLPEEDQERLANLQFKVTSSSDINAYVTSSAMTVTYGMLRFSESDDQLGVVIAHEIAHLVKGHYGKKVASNIASTAVGLAAGIAVDSMLGGGGNTVASAVSSGMSGGFSRDLEREADYYGFQFAYVAGIDLIEGAKIWERMAVEIPSSMSQSIFRTHPPSTERLIRAEKTLLELQGQGIVPTGFQKPGISGVHVSQGMLGKAAAVPSNVLKLPSAVLSNVTNKPMGFDHSSGAVNANESADEGHVQDSEEVQALRAELEKLKQAQAQRTKLNRQTLQKQAEEKAEMERILLEAKESAVALRYSDFGVVDMGLAKQVTNLWVGKSVSGEQQVFSVNQGEIDWYVQYARATVNTMKSIGGINRRYRAYWYSPNGRLYSQQDFEQSRIRSEFAKTSLQWDKDLGNYNVGTWLLRVFENGQLLDERTFEIVSVA